MPKSIRKLPIFVDIETPCAADWEAMPGDACVRHCAVCDKDVYSLSAVSAARAVSLLERGVCVRLQLAEDGAVLHRDRSRGGRAARVVATAALAALAACSEHGAPAADSLATPAPSTSSGDALAPGPASPLACFPGSAPKSALSAANPSLRAPKRPQSALEPAASAPAPAPAPAPIGPPPYSPMPASNGPKPMSPNIRPPRFQRTPPMMGFASIAPSRPHRGTIG